MSDCFISPVSSTIDPSLRLDFLEQLLLPFEADLHAFLEPEAARFVLRIAADGEDAAAGAAGNRQPLRVLRHRAFLR